MSSITPEQVILKAPSKHELVNKQSVIVLATISNQFHEIGMAELTEKVDLRQPFAVALKALLVEDLDGDGQRLEPNPHILVNVAFVHSPEPTFPQNVVGAEALGDGLELEEGEGDDVRVQHRILPRVLEVAWG